MNGEALCLYVVLDRRRCGSAMNIQQLLRLENMMIYSDETVETNLLE